MFTEEDLALFYGKSYPQSTLTILKVEKISRENVAWFCVLSSFFFIMNNYRTYANDQTTPLLLEMLLFLFIELHMSYGTSKHVDTTPPFLFSLKANIQTS